MIDIKYIIASAIESNKNIYLLYTKEIENNRLNWKNIYYIKNCSIDLILKEINTIILIDTDNFVKLCIQDIDNITDIQSYIISLPHNWLC